MSTRKNAKKRTSQLNSKDTEGAHRKKIKENEVGTPAEDVPESVPSKQPIIAPDGKIFYPCQYCSKIFPQKTTSITHMKKCPNKAYNLSVESKNINKNGPVINNNEEHQSTVEENGNLDSSGSSIENKSPEKRIMITQNITVKEPCSQNQVINDASVYDYNEQDSDKSLDADIKKESEDDDRMCKHCKTLFDSPLDLLRHIRDCHNFPRTILPPDEIEKYFDSPNRDFCPICEKPIKTRNYRSVFIKHLLIHTTGLSHECSVCKKKFRRRDHMRAHEKRHITLDGRSILQMDDSVQEIEDEQHENVMPQSPLQGIRNGQHKNITPQSPLQDIQEGQAFNKKTGNMITC